MSTDINNEFLALIGSISSHLNPDEDYVNSEYIARFHKRYEIVKANLESIINTNRHLKIGIVGEVKAGKSSFLNALIFKGESILPKAATPMTAALTKLSYSVEQRAQVEFYSDYDWEQIVNSSSKYDHEFHKLYAERNETREGQRHGRQHTTHKPKQEVRKSIDDNERKAIESQIAPQYRACKELTKMVNDRELPIGEYLNRSIELPISNLQTDLSDYVGANGRLTPLVKKIEVYLDNDLIKEMEVYDTPGLNDPILSRSEVTKQFLVNCDLVFLLSYSGQFLNNEDINFISKTLPVEGIQNAVIIGSKFDSALLDYPSKRTGPIPSFVEGLRSTQSKLNTQAQRNLDECLKSYGTDKTALFSKLRDSLPPFYISSLMYGVAKKFARNDELSEEESLVISNLKSRFSGFEPTSELLYDFSNIDRLKDKWFVKITNEKSRIIEEKSQSAIKTEKSNFMAMLEDINIQANQNLVDIQRYDKAELEEKLTQLEARLNSMRRQIKLIFETCALETRRYINSISLDVKASIKNHTAIETTTRQEEKVESRKEGWFIFKTTKYYTRTSTIHSASVHDVLVNIREYINSSERIINNDLAKAINIVEVKKQVKENVLQAFDLSDTSFDENDIIGPLELVLNQLTLPSFNIERETYNEKLLRTFSEGYVEGNKIHDLFIKQEEVLQSITQDICTKLQRTGDDIEAILIERSGTFIDDVNAHLSENIQSLQKHLKDKENSVHRFQSYIESIRNWKTQLRSYGETSK